MALQKVGIVMIPMIFGPSKSFNEYYRRLSRRDYAVLTVNPYDHPKRRAPFFFWKVAGPPWLVKRRLDRLARSFDHELVIAAVRSAHKKLVDQGCRKIAYLGIGMGGIFSLWAAEENPKPDLVIALYPHLVFPKGFPQRPPDFNKITCPTTLIYGQADNMIEAETLIRANEVKTDHKNVTVVPIPEAGHAFFDEYIQTKFWHSFKNRLFNFKAAVRARDAVSDELMSLEVS